MSYVQNKLAHIVTDGLFLEFSAGTWALDPAPMLPDWVCWHLSARKTAHLSQNGQVCFDSSTLSSQSKYMVLYTGGIVELLATICDTIYSRS